MFLVVQIVCVSKVSIMALTLTLAISEYEHVSDLTTGRVVPEGFRLNCLSLPIEEIFFRFIHYREWDVTELSFAKYLAMRAAGDTSIIALPVFPSRVCRHSSIYVRRGGITEPAQLAGARVGLPEWAQTAAIYSRALLTHEWGIPLQDVEWYQAGVNEPGRAEKVRIHLPDGVRLTAVPDRSLDAMLLDGEVDAVFSARPPRSLADGNSDVVRLFPEFEGIEREYVRRTGIFPIMHVIALRSEVLDEHPWVAMNLLEAFEEAKQRSVARLTDITASRVPLPWGASRMDEAKALFGDDPWPYGVEANRTTLESFIRFAWEQGVIAERLEPEALFPPQVLTRYRV
jgi:4,5-dihydroxyphthalate decarboxylase